MADENKAIIKLKKLTRSNLMAARIVEVNPNNITLDLDNNCVDCMFNPFEYTIAKTNQFRALKTTPLENKPQAEFVGSGAQTLTLNLVFDTYETGENVSDKTNTLWEFMRIKEGKKSGTKKTEKIPPPLVAFEWGGGFRFVAYITNMTQKYTLFKKDGTPVRANVTVIFTQYHDVDDFGNQNQNPTSGGGPAERIRQVVAGDRIDGIAAEEYQDATKWRLIAEHNHLNNPLVLEAGMYLRIPTE